MNLALLPIFLAVGAFVGFLAGLLGIGGGFTIVPVLVEVFLHEGFAREHVVPMAIGTSAATIMFTALSSVRAHHAKGAVNWPIVRAMAPGLVAGSLTGPQIASALPAPIMAGFFGAFIWFGAARMLRNLGSPFPDKGDEEARTFQLLTLLRECKTELLLVDELSLGLAPAVVADLLASIRRLNADGTAVLLVEQSLNVAAAISSRAYFLERGRVRFAQRARRIVPPDFVRRGDVVQHLVPRVAGPLAVAAFARAFEGVQDAVGVGDLVDGGGAFGAIAAAGSRVVGVAFEFAHLAVRLIHVGQ